MLARLSFPILNAPLRIVWSGVLRRQNSDISVHCGPGSGLARYYILVTWATVVALRNYLRTGVPATWESPEGTR